MVARKVRKDEDGENKPRRPPVRTPEARERMMVALAYDEAEKRIREGSATSQELTFFLKLGTQREKAEMKRLAVQTELEEAKKEQIARASDLDQIVADALEAMRSYTGSDIKDFDPDA